MIQPLVLSAQHTGTWFVIDALRICGLDVGNGILHHHLVSDDYVSCIANSDSGAFISDKRATKLCNETTTTIVPVRDPLRAVITREARHPNLNHFHIIRGLECASRMKPRIFLPIDLPWTDSERRSALVEMCVTCCDINEFDQVYKLRDYAESWEPPAYNISPPHPLKEAYESGDYAAIKAGLPEECRMLEDGPLRPWLESLGYSDLLWWA